MDREAGMRKAGPTSADAALVEAARGAPIALYQFRLSPTGAFGLPFVSPDFAARYAFKQGEPEETAARFFSRIHPDDLTRVQDAIARSARTLEMFEGEFRFRLPSGAYVWADARSNPGRTADGGVVWNGIVTDITARKEVESSLRQRERQFRAVLDNLQDAYFRTDLDGRFVMLSPSSTGMYRYASTEELIGQPSRVLFADPEERDRVIAEIREKGFVRDRIGLGRRKDGSTLWTSLNAQPWFDEQGRPAGMEGVARDITARIEAEATLRESESVLEQAQSIARTGSWIADFVAGTFHASTECARLVGKDARSYRPEEVFEVIHQEDLARVKAAWSAAMAGAAYDIEHRVVVNGEVRWLHARARFEFGPDGRPVRAFGVSQDVTSRREAEDAMRKSEELFRAVLENLQDAYFRTDRSGRLILLSPSAARMFGFSGVADLVGQLAESVFEDPEDPQRILDEIHAKGRVRDRSLLGRRKDGSTFWISLNAQPWLDEQGRRAGMEGVARDITARIEAEATLHGSEERFRLFIRHAPVAIAMFDRDMRYVAASRRWLSDYGLGDRDLTGLSHYEVFPEIPERWKELHRRCLAGEVVRAEEDRFERADGSVQWLRWEIRPWRTDDQDVGGIVMFTEDITERKRAAEALAASETRYRALFENAAEGIVAVDPDSKRFQFFNPALCAMFGYAPDEFGRLTLADIHPKEAIEGVLGAFRKLASGTPLVSPVIPCLRKDGTAFVADIRASLVEIAGRRVIFGFFTDVTARVRLEGQLLQSQKMEAVGQLAGGVAHDFNNLLTVISGNCDLLLSGARADDPTRGPLTDIRLAGERAANLTRQLLAFSRKQILEPRLVDVHDIVIGIEKMLRRLLGEDVELLTDLAADQSWVKVDPGQLEQVVMNLAVNARDAMPRGGRITIRTRNLAPSDTVVLEETAGRQLRPKVAISISDTGTGILPDAKAHLFEPFFTTKGVGKGTGLGLATVFGIVKQSGGDITVESEPGRGATFTVILPSHAEPRRRSGSGASLRAVPRGTETVLVVEDEDAVRRIVKIALESAGYRVIEARNGPEALEEARAHSGEIHLVVTDVVMPEMSGRELVERIVEDHPGVRILYMSGYTDDAVMRHGIVDSGVAFLQKPFTPLALARKVREVLDGKVE